MMNLKINALLNWARHKYFIKYIYLYNSYIP